MVEIISKRDGPRREDVEARRHIRDNWGTIETLANRLSNGGYAAMRKRQAQPQPNGAPGGSTFHILGGPAAAASRPYVRISPNNRVVVMDLASGKQMHFLGEIRRREGVDRFLLARAENGFRHPMDDALQDRLADLDAQAVDASFDEDALSEAISQRLGLS